MRFVFDENIGPKIVEVIAGLQVNAVRSTELCPSGTSDPDLIARLEPDDVLVTFDKSMLGLHTEVLIRSRTAVVKLKGNNLRFRQKIGLFLCFEDQICARLDGASRPCVLTVTRAGGVGDLRAIQPQSLPYGGPPRNA